MSDHSIQYISGALRASREQQGLSQRELSARSGVPQSHISRIESGSVDLRTSSLVALARALGLELMLIPRKAVPAAQSIVRTDTHDAPVRPAYGLDEDAHD